MLCQGSAHRGLAWEAAGQQTLRPKGFQSQGPSNTTVATVPVLFTMDGEAGSCCHPETHQRLCAFLLNVTRANRT